MDRYSARIDLHGVTKRERELNLLKASLANDVPSSLSCKDILLNGVESKLVINTGTKPYYKEFETLPGQTVKMGDYIQWSNRTWLVYEADADDEVYIDGKMYECNYHLYWQDSTGKIIDRWAYIQNSSSYSNGESGNSTITLSANQFMVWMSLDEDTINMEGNRLFIDNRTNDKPTPYKLTRPDNVTMRFGDVGCTYYIFTLDQRNDEKDKRVTLEDGTIVWIADYIAPTTPSNPENGNETVVSWYMKIDYANLDIKPTGMSKTFTAHLYDSDDNEITQNIEYVWTVRSDIQEYITYLTSINTLTISLSEDCEEFGKEISITCASKYTGQADEIILTTKEMY